MAAEHVRYLTKSLLGSRFVNNTGTNGNTAPPAAPTAKVNVEVFYVHPDHLGTPCVITASTALAATTGTGITSAQTVNKAVWRWDSDPFGSNATANSAPNENPNTLSQVVGTATLPYLFGFDLAFPGQKRDRETGKHYNYFRDYDPSIGWYFESDPIGLKAGLSTFGYADQSPIVNYDPDGLFVWTLPLLPSLPGWVSGGIGFGIGAGLASKLGDMCRDDKEHCTRLYVRCVQESWGGDWTCGDCQFFCTGHNGYWPTQHCSPDSKRRRSKGKR